MAHYPNLIFPTDVSVNSDGAATYSTEVMISNDGRETRIARWARPIMVYNVAWGIRTLEQLADVRAVFRAAEGRRHSFLYRDPFDYRSGHVTASQARSAPLVDVLDQPIGTGDGETTEFSLVKNYTVGGVTRSRTILCPDVSTVRVALAGVEQSSGWTVNGSTGVVTFDSPPYEGEQVRAGFEFYVPVRFDTDTLPLTLENYGYGSALEIKLREVRELEASA